MVEVTVQNSDVELSEPTVVEGLPGVGLVGKIATDHLVNEFDIRYYADVVGDGIPPVAAFDGGDPAVKAPTRLLADPERDLLALRGDVPVSAINAPTFAEGLTEWFLEREATPIYLTGVPGNRDPDSTPETYGIAAGDAVDGFAETGVDAPEENGMISGPAGALLSHAQRRDLGAIGLVVETDPRFPDPLGARTLIEEGIGPIAGIDVDTDPPIDEADEIIKAREQLAQRMQRADQHEGSQAESIDMYQ